MKVDRPLCEKLDPPEREAHLAAHMMSGGRVRAATWMADGDDDVTGGECEIKCEIKYSDGKVSFKFRASV